MKYLQDYTEQATTELLNKTGSFFAFSDDQFEKAKNKNLKKEDYTHLFGGLITPKTNSKEVLNGLKQITKAGISLDIKENGIINIIKRELNNHEAYYSGNIESTVAVLEIYNLTPEQIYKVFKNKNTTADDIKYIQSIK